MLISPVKFPSSDGEVVIALLSGLSSWTGIDVHRNLPATKVARMVTVRNDSGPQDRLRSFRRYGINVWADSSVDAEQIALDGMAVLRLLRSAAIVSTDGFTGPYEVEDEVPTVVGDKSLTHFYFGVRLHIRGSNI